MKTIIKVVAASAAFYLLCMVIAFGIGAAVDASQAADAKAPLISKDVRDAVTEASARVQALTYARQVLQKELDAETADLTRAAQQAAAQCAATPGYELGASLVCVPKTEKGKDAPGTKPGGGM